MSGHIDISDKISQVGSGTFPLVGADDIDTTTGQRLGATTKQAIVLTAGGGKPATTNGASSGPTQKESTTNKVDYWAMNFAAQPGADKFAFWGPIWLPSNWDASTITAEFCFTPTASEASAAHNVQFSLAGVCIAAGSNLDTAYGTAQSVSTTVSQTTANQIGAVQISAQTAAITVSGAAADTPMFLRVARLNADTFLGAIDLLYAIVRYGISKVSVI